MGPVSSQKNTIGSGALKKRVERERLWPRWKALRLRRKPPHWVGIALLVLAGDVVLAAVVWTVVGFLR
jgi:hypothetical protein